MRDGARTAVAAALAAAVVLAAWLRIEQPFGPFWRALLLVVLALAAAALHGWRLRIAGSLVASVLAARIAFGVWLPLHPVGAGSYLGNRFGSGFLDFYATHLPFDPRVHVAMAEVVLVAVFCFTLLVALLAAGRRPVAAALALLAGAGWPATLLNPAHGIPMGAAILAAGLVLLAVLGSRQVPALALPVAAVVITAAVAVGSATASRHPALNWKTWNPAKGSAPASVSFVWNSQYRGLHWPRKSTVMLDVRSRTRPSYLRAAVLDDFTGGRWVDGGLHAADGLEPAAARIPANETKQSITVEGLSDLRLVGGSIPVRFASSSPIYQPEPGFAFAVKSLDRGSSYRVWSYAPSPSRAELSHALPEYPSALRDDGMLEIADGVEVPPFGVANRRADLLAALTYRFDLYHYLPLARLAERVTRGARTPYAAVYDLERWFLVDGGFSYSNRPTVVGPPLVGFVTTTHAGYCQYFAGAMALMLRYLGIPARVAVGFAAPRFDPASRAWVVTDHDAHAWVEVWFRGYGWLPFDPTPAAPGSGRAKLLARFTQVGGSGESAPTSGPRIAKSNSAKAKESRADGHHHADSAAHANRTQSGARDGLSWWFVLLLVVAAVIGAIAATKEGLRRSRRATDDPRRLAGAYREELASFLLDQGMAQARNATVRELCELVRRQLGLDAQPFVVAVTAARFGRAENAADSSRVARDELRELLAECRGRFSRRERVLGFLSLRSLARRRAAVEWSASLSGVSG